LHGGKRVGRFIPLLRIVREDDFGNISANLVYVKED